MKFEFNRSSGFRGEMLESVDGQMFWYILPRSFYSGEIIKSLEFSLNLRSLFTPVVVMKRTYEP